MTDLVASLPWVGCVAWLAWFLATHPNESTTEEDEES